MRLDGVLITFADRRYPRSTRDRDHGAGVSAPDFFLGSRPLIRSLAHLWRPRPREHASALCSHSHSTLSGRKSRSRRNTGYVPIVTHRASSRVATADLARRLAHASGIRPS